MLGFWTQRPWRHYHTGNVRLLTNITVSFGKTRVNAMFSLDSDGCLRCFMTQMLHVLFSIMCLSFDYCSFSSWHFIGADKPRLLVVSFLHRFRSGCRLYVVNWPFRARKWTNQDFFLLFIPFCDNHYERNRACQLSPLDEKRISMFRLLSGMLAKADWRLVFCQCHFRHWYRVGH